MYEFWTSYFIPLGMCGDDYDGLESSQDRSRLHKGVRIGQNSAKEIDYKFPMDSCVGNRLINRPRDDFFEKKLERSPTS
jgi:hypothetical protein